MPGLRSFARFHVFLLISASALALASFGFDGQAGLAYAAAPPAPSAVAPVDVSLRTGAHETFDRLAFDARQGLAYHIEREKTEVRIVFDAPGHFSIKGGMKLTRVFDVKSGGGNGADATHVVVRFRVAQDATLKDFTSGAAIVIDIYGRAAPQEPLPPAPGIPAKQMKGDSTVADKKTTEATPVPAPAARVPPPMTPPSVATPTQTPSGPKPEKKEVETKAVSQAVSSLPAPVETAGNMPPVSAAPRQAVRSGLLVPPASGSAPGFGPMQDPEIDSAPLLVAAFDPKIATGAVIYTRGRDGVILFDRKITLDPQTLTAAAPLKTRLWPLDLPRNNGFRFRLPRGASLQATRKGTVWQIFFSRLNGDLTVPSNFVAQPDFALGARLLVPQADPPAPVRMIDPIVGDELILVPLRTTDAFSATRHFVDLTVLPAAQGLVVKPLQDKLSVRSVSDGVEITTEGGLRLSPRLDTAPYENDAGTSGARGGPEHLKSIFDFGAWHGNDRDGFTKNRQALMQSILDAAPPDRSLARLQLARFYFAHGFGEEALSILGYLEMKEPDLVKYNEFLALRGAAKILAWRAQDGLDDLSNPELADMPEAVLWRGVGEAEKRLWPEAFSHLMQTWSLLKTYPDPFLTRFGLLAVETAIAVGNDEVADQWLHTVEQRSEDNRAAGPIAYLKGALASRAGQADKAAAYWREAAKGDDRLYKIRAELALIDLAVVTRSLSPAQAAERLEGLRFAWRGDDLEQDILTRLGGFYLDAGKIKEGLATYNRAITLYPEGPFTPQIKQEMTQVYRDLFLGNKGDSLSPLELLNLYRTYASLRPDNADGLKMGQKLAEKIVSIDLLDQAADIMTEQLKNSTKNGLSTIDKTRLGTRLAGVLLLDQKADAALAALDQSQPDAATKISDAQASERTILRAHALALQKKTDAALALLQNNDTQAAQALRADVLMHAQRWKEAAEALMAVAGPPGGKLDASKSEALLNAAISLSMVGDTVGLDKLAIDYGTAMRQMPQANLFSILTRPEKSLEARDLRGASARVAEVDLFRSFLDAYRHSDSALKNAAP